MGMGNKGGKPELRDEDVALFCKSSGTPDEVLSKIFRLFDYNSDGTITAKEMKRLVKDMYGLIKADDPEAESQDLIAKNAVAEMDEDGDGKVSEAEFTAACLSQDKLSTM